MKRKSARLVVLLLALAGIFSTAVPSAQATTLKTITVTGNVTLSVGLQYPCAENPPTTACTNSTTSTKTGVKPNTSVVNNHPVGGRTANFGFASTGCVKTSTTTNKFSSKDGQALCTITASGTITGFCGFSTGSGTLTLSNLSGNKASITMPFKLTGTGGTLSITAGNSNEHIVGDVVATPTPNTGSCATGGAHQFIVTGELEYTKCTRFFLFSCF